MKVAAYQAPLLESGSLEAIDLISAQVRVCEERGVEILCCPEAILGGLADNAQAPADIALEVEELEELLGPLFSDSVSIIVGFTEASGDGHLYNSAAVLQRGKILGTYRKLHPAINRSVYTPGDKLPTFTIGPLRFGIVICNDSNYAAPAQTIAAQGAAALFIPMNNGLPPHKADVVSVARTVHSTTAKTNRMVVVAADVSGRCGSLVSYGATGIYDADGRLLAASQPLRDELLVADIEVSSLSGQFRD